MRYYYNCPYQALYMQEHFGVEFEPVYFLGERSHPFGTYEEGYKQHVKFLPDFDKIYIAPESESIFQPKEGDMITHTDRPQDSDGYLLSAQDMPSVWLEIYFEKIIMRDNKHFFAPEIELTK